MMVAGFLTGILAETSHVVNRSVCLVNRLSGDLPKLSMTAALVVAVSSCSNSNEFLIDRTPTKVEEVPPTNLSIDKSKILESHNAVRRKLGVPPLQWSTRLESLAAGWANFLVSEAGCTVRRRGTIGLPTHTNGVGENLQIHEPVRFDDGRSEVADIDEHDVVVEWARQSADYNYTSLECASGKQCENYTQVVWRGSEVLGCAAASCPSNEQIWVCNYDPPGNFLNQRPF